MLTCTVGGNNPQFTKIIKQLENTLIRISVEMSLIVTRKVDMNTKYLAILPALALLSACGGGGTSTNFVGFATKGVQAANLVADYGSAPLTSVANMPSGTYNYTGVGGFVFGNRSNEYIATQALALGDVNLQANFTTNTISGSLTNFVDYNNIPGAGQVNLRNGVINGNVFSADATGSVTNNGIPLVVQADLVGGFYGNSANALLGRMDGTWGGNTVSGLIGGTK